MRYVLYAFTAGAISAFAFEPAAFWPLLLIAFAFLCEFACRSKSLGRALLTGWAFGVGLTRLVMMRYAIDDIRQLQGGDLRFLRQF